MVVLMGLSPFDRRLLTEGLAYFTTPRLASLLEMLGKDEGERAATLTAMLRNASEDEAEEFANIVERATARVAREQARAARRETEQDRS